MLNEALPPHLQKHFRKDGSSIHQHAKILDRTPPGYGPDDASEGGREEFSREEIVAYEQILMTIENGDEYWVEDDTIDPYGFRDWAQRTHGYGVHDIIIDSGEDEEGEWSNISL